MSLNSTEHSVLFQDAFRKPVVVKFDAEGQSSDGGVVLLEALDRGLGLTQRLAKHLIDERHPERITHTYEELFRQRVLGLALGYEDCNDAEHMRSDPCMKLACDRSPLDPEDDLGSQPTLSRFENSQDARTIVDIQRELEEQVISRLAKKHRRAKLVTIDLDPSCDPTHGQQEFAFFHGKYGTWCFLPQFGFLTIDDGTEQYLFHARLRPGNARCYRGAVPLLRRTVARVRRCFPKAKIRVRLDAGFAVPSIFEALDELRVQYLVSMSSNSALEKAADPWMEEARSMTEDSGETTTLFCEDPYYKARSWKRHRRVVMKAEVLQYPGREPKDNLRCVVTNLRHRPQTVYEIYCRRGDAENRIKEMQALQSDRTSCARFLTNQLRLTMTATAYVLFQDLRSRLRGTKAHRAQVSQLQKMLMKVGTRVVASVRRFVLHFPTHHPWKDIWSHAARAVDAVPR